MSEVVGTSIAPETPAPSAPPVTLVKVPGGRPDLDGPITDAAVAAQAIAAPLKVRLSITFSPGERNYTRWNGVHWLLAFDGATADGLLPEFREALDGFIRGWVERARG